MEPPAGLSFTFAGGDVFTSEFRLLATDPRWSARNQTTDDAVLIAFPRTPVAIEHERRPEVIADSLSAVVYAPGQRYRRRLIAATGDDCTVVAVTGQVAAEAAADAVAGAARVRAGDESLSFPFVAAHVSRDALLAVQSIRARVAAGTPVEVDQVRERLLAVVGEVITNGYLDACRTATVRASTLAVHREIVAAVRERIARDPAESPSLEDVARDVNASAFHLARVFRRMTGTSIHAYRNELRVRASLAPIADGLRLADVAQTVGFASHAHLTDRFRRTFGLSPADWRTSLVSRRETSRIMEARGRRAFLA